jgi:hypothetical protein
MFQKEKSDHFVGDSSDGVRVVHPFPVIRERGTDVDRRLLVPVRQEVVLPVVGERLDRRGHAVPSGCQGFA